ncbi:MAG: PAS domain S-box protein, partial [Candidatus Methanolliviera hydrocarbonicum]
MNVNEDNLEKCRKDLEKERAFAGRLLDSVPTPMSITTLDGKIISANSRCEDFFGRSNEELGEVLLEDLYEESDEVREAFEEAKRTGFSTCEATLIDGKRAILNFSPIRDEDGSIINVIGTAQEIALERRLLFRNLPIPASLMTPEGMRIDANLACENYFKRGKEEYIGAKLEELYVREDIPKIREALEDCKRTGFASCEAMVVKGDGTKAPVIMNLTAIKDRKGDVINIIATAQDISELSELKEREEELKKEEEFAESLFKSLPISATLYTPEGDRKDVNLAREKVFGRTGEDLLTIRPEEIYREEDVAKVEESVEVCKETGFSSCEVTAIRGDGTEFPIIINRTPIKDEEGNLLGYIGTATDISELKEKERELADEKAFNDHVIDRIGEGLIIGDDRGKIVRINPAAERIIGYKADESLGINTLKHPAMTDEGKEILEDMWMRVLSGETVHSVDMPFVRKSGEKITVSATQSEIKDAEGNVIAGAFLLRDVTETKRATSEISRVLDAASNENYTEKVDLTGITGDLKVMAEDVNETMGDINTLVEEIKNSEKVLSKIIEENPVPMAIVNEDLDVLDVNETYLDLTGYSRGDMVSKNLRKDFKVVETVEGVNIKEAMERGGRAKGMNVVDTPNGRLTFIVGALPYEDISTNEKRVLMTYTDITELKEKEKEIEKEKAYTTDLLSSMPDPLCVVDMDGIRVDSNPALERITGLSREELIGKPSNLVLVEEDRPKAKKLLKKTIEEGFVTNFELTIRSKERKRIPVLADTTVRRDEDGKPIGVTLNFRDITELKEKEAQIIENSKYLQREAEKIKEAMKKASEGYISVRLKKEQEDAMGEIADNINLLLENLGR